MKNYQMDSIQVVFLPADIFKADSKKFIILIN